VLNAATGETVRVAFDARVGCIADIAAAVPNAPAVSTWTPMSLEWLFGFVFAPIAFAMGVPMVDCLAVGQLMGQKMAINEFVAYLNLSILMGDEATALQDRSALIATYALCGFANFGSIGIQIGGIAGIAPDRRSDLARLGMRAMIGGSLAAFLTATIAGMLL
jgi:CNT family concentrative nucleoside transporter